MSTQLQKKRAVAFIVILCVAFLRLADPAAYDNYERSGQRRRRHSIFHWPRSFDGRFGHVGKPGRFGGPSDTARVAWRSVVRGVSPVYRLLALLRMLDSQDSGSKIDLATRLFNEGKSVPKG